MDKKNKSEENYDLLIRLDEKVNKLDEHFKEVSVKIDTKLQEKEEVTRTFARHENVFKELSDEIKEVKEETWNVKTEVKSLIDQANAKTSQVQMWGTIIGIILGISSIVQLILFFNK